MTLAPIVSDRRLMLLEVIPWSVIDDLSTMVTEGATIRPKSSSRVHADDPAVVPRNVSDDAGVQPGEIVGETRRDPGADRHPARAEDDAVAQIPGTIPTMSRTSRQLDEFINPEIAQLVPNQGRAKGQGAQRRDLTNRAGNH